MEPFKMIQVILVTAKVGTHQDVIEAVAKASLLCLAAADRSQPEWVEWLSGPFAKVAKQCSATKVSTALDEVEGGRYVEVGAARVAAFPPSDAAHRHHVLHKAQLQGLNRPVVHDQPALDIATRSTPVVLVNRDLGMSTGKASAQAAHGLCSLALSHGLSADQMCALAEVVTVAMASVEDLLGAAALPGAAVIHDAGHTEIPSGSLTAVGLAPSGWAC